MSLIPLPTSKCLVLQAPKLLFSIIRLKLKPGFPGPAGTSTSFGCLHVKHRKREPKGVHEQLEGFNRNLRPKATVANNNNLAPKYSCG